MSHDFDTIIRKLRPYLMFKAVQLCHNTPAAEDLVQDTFLDLFLVWEKFDPQDQDPVKKARNWALLIMKNRFLDGWRKRTRQAAILDGCSEMVAHETIGSRGDGHYMAAFSLVEGFLEFADDQTRVAILNLNEIQRDAILRTARGDSDEEIAEANGVDCRQARKRRHYARKNIAEALLQNSHNKL
jgi:RNA polymerase sigma factor (sigma-70 family)